LFAKKRTKLNKEKNEEIESVKKNTEIIKEMDAKIDALLRKTIDIRDGLNESYRKCLSVYGGDYCAISDNEKQALGSLVNNTLTLSAMLNEVVEEAE
jgi:hypothetical protein